MRSSAGDSEGEEFQASLVAIKMWGKALLKDGRLLAAPHRTPHGKVRVGVGRLGGWGGKKIFPKKKRKPRTEVLSARAGSAKDEKRRDFNRKKRKNRGSDFQRRVLK